MPNCFKRVGQERPGAAIEISRGDDVVAGRGDVENGEGRRGLTGRHGHGGDTALDLGDARLERILRRITEAGVDEAQLFKAEQAGGVASVLELVGRRLMDRHRDRTGGRVGTEAATMQREGFRMQRLAHEDTPSSSIALMDGLDRKPREEISPKRPGS